MDQRLKEALFSYLELLVEDDRRVVQETRSLLGLFAHNDNRKKLTRYEKRLKLGEALLEALRQTSSEMPPAPLAGPEPDPPSPPLIEIVEKAVDKDKKAKPSKASLTDPDEANLIRVYNEQPGQWRQRYQPENFGAANHKALFKGDERKADFQLREEGSYELVRLANRCYVVPRPRLKLQDFFFRAEAVNELFENDYKVGSIWDRILLVRPAIVKLAGDRWVVEKPGSIREGTASDSPGAKGG